MLYLPCQSDSKVLTLRFHHHIFYLQDSCSMDGAIDGTTLQFTYQSKFSFLPLSQIRLKIMQGTTQGSLIHTSQKINLYGRVLEGWWVRSNMPIQILAHDSTWSSEKGKYNFRSFDQIVKHNANILVSGPKFLRVEYERDVTFTKSFTRLLIHSTAPFPVDIPSSFNFSRGPMSVCPPAMAETSLLTLALQFTLPSTYHEASLFLSLFKHTPTKPTQLKTLISNTKLRRRGSRFLGVGGGT